VKIRKAAINRKKFKGFISFETDPVIQPKIPVLFAFIDISSASLCLRDQRTPMPDGDFCVFRDIGDKIRSRTLGRIPGPPPHVQKEFRIGALFLRTPSYE
jgi:hypothetical protein